jgi:hypothetical protein
MPTLFACTSCDFTALRGDDGEDRQVPRTDPIPPGADVLAFLCAACYPNDLPEAA